MIVERARGRAVVAEHGAQAAAVIAGRDPRDDGVAEVLRGMNGLLRA